MSIIMGLGYWLWVGVCRAMLLDCICSFARFSFMSCFCAADFYKLIAVIFNLVLIYY